MVAQWAGTFTVPSSELRFRGSQKRYGVRLGRVDLVSHGRLFLQRTRAKRSTKPTDEPADEEVVVVVVTLTVVAGHAPAPLGIVLGVTVTAGFPALVGTAPAARKLVTRSSMLTCA